MNRILTSLLTIALLASCAKTEVQYEPAGEISFAPVSKLSTKVALVGTGYPADLDMYIFANAGLPEASAPDGFTEPYFRNALFHRSSDGIFSGAPAHYWPNVKKLVFSGVSASGNINAQSNAATIEYEQLKLVIDDYRPDGSDIVVTETKDIPLKYNDAGDPWKAGVHYTYNIIIGTKEILVSPTVDDWDPVTVPSVSL